jgi:large subunit ribosomal protein L25
VKDVQYNLLTETVTHIDLYEVEAGKMLRTKIRIKLTGTPDGIRLGGVLEAGFSELDVECLPKDLPERVVVDCSGLQLNHSLHVRDIKLSSAVKVLTDPELSIATLKYTKVDVPAAAEAAPAEGAAPAAGAASAAAAAPAAAAPAAK